MISIQNRAGPGGLLLCCLTLALCGQPLGSLAAMLVAQTNVLGLTPEVLGFNLGHFFPGSNTREWWRYAGVNGARVFLSPAEIEPEDDLPPVGDGVADAAGFTARRALVRANPLDPALINWDVFTNRYEANDLYPVNHIRVNYALGELCKLNIEVCAQITASQSRLPVAGTADWPNMWELWQHYYAQAFYLGRHFNVARYQMFNEPNHSNAGGLTPTNFLLRLQLASDAIQCALADVNSRYGKNLQPRILAPVTAGTADGPYPTWGQPAVANRHRHFLGEVDPSFSLLHVYDYHQYNSTPAVFGSDLAELRVLLARDLAPEPPLPVSISEFNTHTGATFDTMAETLDSPSEFPRFGAILVNLAAALCQELYCFKFSQTGSSNPNYPVQKNAMHYVDNEETPYNVGGITRAGEVWRLFSKCSRRGGQRLGLVRDAGAIVLDAQACRDPTEDRYFLFSANNTANDVPLLIDLRAWSIPPTNRVFIEEVSETCHGAGAVWVPTGSDAVLSATQKAHTVWLLSASPAPQAAEQVIPAGDDTAVRDGTNRELNYGDEPEMTVRNDPLSATNRSVAFVSFELTPGDRSGLQFALLCVDAASTTNSPAQAHVYGLDRSEWSEADLTWSTAPNLRQYAAPGTMIRDAVVYGLGQTLHLQGQLVATTTNFTESLIDVSRYVRAATNDRVSFLISQDPRWNLALPSLEPGDSQSGGVRIRSKESGASGPRLRLAFSVASRRAPVIKRMARDAGGTVRLDLAGVAGFPHVLEVATNLPAQAWLSLATNAPDDTGLWSVTDSAAAGFPTRFYRAVLK